MPSDLGEIGTKVRVPPPGRGAWAAPHPAATLVTVVAVRDNATFIMIASIQLPARRCTSAIRVCLRVKRADDRTGAQGSESSGRGSREKNSSRIVVMTGGGDECLDLTLFHRGKNNSAPCIHNVWCVSEAGE